MVVVMRQLKEIANIFCKRSRAEVSILEQVRDYRNRFLDLQMKETVRQRQDEAQCAKELKLLRACVVCFNEHINLRDGVDYRAADSELTTSQFYCQSCFSQNVLSQTSVTSRGHFIIYGSRILCTLCLHNDQDLDYCIFSEKQIARSSTELMRLWLVTVVRAGMLQSNICKREVERFASQLEEMLKLQDQRNTIDNTSPFNR